MPIRKIIEEEELVIRVEPEEIPSLARIIAPIVQQFLANGGNGTARLNGEVIQIKQLEHRREYRG